MRKYQQRYEQTRAGVKGKIIDLPRSQWTVVEKPPKPKPAPRRIKVYRDIAAIVGVALLFAVGMI
jgi:hypothetical protein